MEGKVVRKPEQITDKETYVATGSEPLLPRIYGQPLPQMSTIAKKPVQSVSQSVVRQKKRLPKKSLTMDHKRVDHSKSSVQTGSNYLPEDLAATRIQAGFRGYRFRKEHPELIHTTHRTHTYTSPRTAGSIRHSSRNEPHELTPNTAATRIQAGYRGYQTRKQLHHYNSPLTTHSTSKPSLPPDLAATKIQAGFRGHRTRMELKEQHKYPETERQLRAMHLDDVHADPNYAATRIQATFRGYQTRRALHGQNHASDQPTKSPLHTQDRNTQIKQPYANGHDLAEVDKAATIIQAGFRGYRTRKHLHPTNPVTSANKENADQAATRIQAAYRGFATRKHLHENTMEPTRINQPVRTTMSTRYTDPSEAATKIQATFRGYRTRQQVHLPHGTVRDGTTRNSTGKSGANYELRTT